MIAPSRTITVAGVPVRLYPAPEPGASFPWASFGDLLHVAGFPAEALPFWAERWRQIHPTLWAEIDGEMIVPEEAGIGLFDASRQAGWPEAERAASEFISGSRALFVEVHRGLDLPEFRAAVNEAVLRSMLAEVMH